MTRLLLPILLMLATACQGDPSEDPDDALDDPDFSDPDQVVLDLIDQGTPVACGNRFALQGPHHQVVFFLNQATGEKVRVDEDIDVSLRNQEVLLDDGLNACSRDEYGPDATNSGMEPIEVAVDGRIEWVSSPDRSSSGRAYLDVSMVDVVIGGSEPRSRSWDPVHGTVEIPE